MGQEINQYDIPDRQLLATNAQASVWTDIGEARVIHTIFGRAKIRVIREQDKNLRAGLLTVLVVTAIAAAAWQGWITSQQTEPVAAPPLPLSARIRVSAPDFQPEYITSSATPPSVAGKPSMPVQTAISNPAASRSSASQQPVGLKASGKMAVKPDMAQPLIASRPQTGSPVANNSSSMNQTDMPRLHKLSAPLQSVAPTIATSPATKVASQPVASRPVAPLPAPLEVTPTKSLAGTNQPSEPVSAQP